MARRAPPRFHAAGVARAAPGGIPRFHAAGVARAARGRIPRSVAAGLASAAQGIAAALAPPLCAACGAWAARTEPLCPECRAGLRWLPPEPVFLGAVPLWAPVAYDGPARALVRGLKFAGVARAAGAMAAQIAANAPPALLHAAVLVPVPLHPARLRRRGYNQAGRIADELARRTGLAVADCLERAGPAGTQVGRGRTERLAGIGGAVRVRAGAGAPPAALLVDDVATTGGTISACAAALRAAGTRLVAAVAYARTPGR